jgi:serine/threonine protein kinase
MMYSIGICLPKGAFVQAKDDIEILRETLPEAFRSRFEILEKLGTGGTGTVYKGYDKTLRRSLALKVLNHDQISPEKIARLHREAKTLCQLKHPNIVAIYDFIVTTDEKPVMVMECVNGTPLDSSIEYGDESTVEESLELIMQVCKAMEFAHTRNVYHRDLTPNNILVRKKEDGCYEVKVVDFGIAKVENVLHSTIAPSGSLVGSITVISPEQAKGEVIDQRSDIYSLGCTMFKVLTGRFPYDGDSLIEVINQHLNAPVPSLSSANPGTNYPEGLNAIVTKALQKNPEDRFDSMKEMRDAIDKVLHPIMEFTNDHVTRSKAPKGAWVTLSAMTFLSLLAFLIIANKALDGKPDEKTSGPPPERLRVLRRNEEVWISPTKEQFKQAIEFMRTNPRVRRLDLKGLEITRKELSEFLKLPLISLDLRRTDVSDDMLNLLPECPTLRAVILNECKNLTDSGFANLALLPNLICIGLSETFVSDRAIENLVQSNHSIRTIHLLGCRKITDAAVPLILSEKKLDSLRIGKTSLTRIGVKKLMQGGSDLGNLTISDLDLEDSDIMPARNIYRVDVSNNPKLTPDVLMTFRKWPNLFYVNVVGCPKIPNSEMRQMETALAKRHMVVSPSESFEQSNVDTEPYFEPKLYDLTKDSQPKIKVLILYWTGMDFSSGFADDIDLAKELKNPPESFNAN